MYTIMVFSGGPHNFHEFQEFVEDAGGIILRRDVFTVSRGQYFLRNELRVLCIIPRDEEEATVETARRVKGEVERADIDRDTEKRILSCLSIHDALCVKGDWTAPPEIMSDSDLDGDNLDVLETMVEMELLEKRVIDGKIEYRVPR